MSVRACARIFLGDWGVRAQTQNGNVYVFAPIVVRLQHACRADCFEAALEVGKETARDVAVDDTMVE